MDASNLLKPALARGELHCIGAREIKPIPSGRSAAGAVYGRPD
jgi:hypothetical protein